MWYTGLYKSISRTMWYGTQYGTQYYVASVAVASALASASVEVASASN